MTDTLHRPWHTTQADPVTAELARLRRQRDDQARTIERLRAEAETDAIAHRRLTKDTVKDPKGSFLILRRSLVRAYLVARIEFEGNPGPAAQAAYETAREVLALAYKAEGEGSLEEVLPRVDRLDWLIAEQYVELWAHRENVLDDLDTGAIVTVAQDVREMVAAGYHLDDMGMAGLVEPYLPGGAA